MSVLECPRCLAHPLTRSNFGCLCSECEGCWFDFEQFEKALQISDLELALSPIEPTLVASVDDIPLEELITCPRCEVRMKRHISMFESGVTIDLCRSHGMWLDDGELVKIRTYLNDNTETATAAPQSTGIFAFFRRIFRGGV